MRPSTLRGALLPAIIALAAVSICLSLALRVALFGSTLAQSKSTAGANNQACPSDDSGLKLSAGFCATVFADGIGHARHMVAAPSGVLYVNTWSGRYYGNDSPHAGGFLVALQDKNGFI